MIARVRIAPIEQWCSEVMKTADEPEVYGTQSEVGMYVEILTESMRPSRDADCGGNEWALTDKSLDELVARTGAEMPIRPCFICEHMLEMD
jgi:hypothetical protein